MDLSSASAISTYNYQGALKAGGQASAVLQALAGAYASQNTPVSGEPSAPDSLTALAGSSALGALVSGIYSTAVASGGGSSAIQGLSTSGGMDATSVKALLGGGPSGFSSVTLSASEALAAYRYHQDTKVSSNTQSSASAVYAQQLALTAQAFSFSSPLNMLA